MADLDRPFWSSKKLLGVLVLLCVIISSSFVVVSSNIEDFLEPECLKVTKYEFNNSVKTIVDVIRQVTSILSQFGNFLGDFRVSNAVNDCVDLLDSSAEELSWTVSATQNPKGMYCL